MSFDDDWYYADSYTRSFKNGKQAVIENGKFREVK
jgi:hypothetical protein